MIQFGQIRKRFWFLHIILYVVTFETGRNNRKWLGRMVHYNSGYGLDRVFKRTLGGWKLEYCWNNYMRRYSQMLQ